MQFGLSGAYDLGQWQVMDAPHPDPSGQVAYSIATSGSAELPFPSAPDEGPWSETILGELAANRPGVVVRWELLPDPGIPSLASWLLEPAGSPVEEPRVRSLPERAILDRRESRRTGLRWRVRGEIEVGSHPENRDAASRVAHLLEIASHLDGGNGFVCRSTRPLVPAGAPGAILTEAEVVGIFPPYSSVAFALAPEEDQRGLHLWLGRDVRGSSVGLPLDSAQGRHLLILGETGMGKSSLVVRLAWQALRWGTVLFFDPIGDTARVFLAGLPPGRASGVSWVSPADPALTMNLLTEISASRGDRPAERERRLGDVVAALRRVRAGRYTDSAYWGPRLEEMLVLALRAASRWPGASLAVAERLLTPEGWPLRTVPETAREAVFEVRRRIDSAPQDGDGARRLISEITRSEVLREMLDAEAPTWHVEAAVSPGHTTVISGDAPQVGESTARYLLAVVLALAWNSILVRREPTKTFLILDEAQWYVHESVSEMLRLGRRFNLHVWAATQSLGTLPESVRDAFTTNSADLVLFRGAPDDVREFSRWAPDLVPQRLMRMPRGEAAVLVGKGSATHWVQLTPPKPAPTGPTPLEPHPDSALPVEPSGDIGGKSGLLPGSADEPSDSTDAFKASPLGVALREALDGTEGQAEFVVHLVELRARWPDEPALAERRVRHGGRLLTAAGALLRTGRDDKGGFWVLSRARLGELLFPDTEGFRPRATA